MVNRRKRKPYSDKGLRSSGKPYKGKTRNGKYKKSTYSSALGI